MVSERFEYCKEPVNLHDDYVKAAIGEGEETKEVIDTPACILVFSDISFLDNDRDDPITKLEKYSNEVIDLKDLHWHQIMPVVHVHLAGEDGVDDDADDHQDNNQPRHDIAYVHVRNSFMACCRTGI